MAAFREFTTAFALLTAAAAFGQMNTGEIAGNVRDQLGGVLPGATVSATHTATARKFAATSNDSGEFLLAHLPVGAYSLAVDAPNFKRSVLSAIEVHVGETLRYDLTLQVGDAGDVVVVESGAAGLPLQSGEIKDVIRNRQVIDLPLKGRQFLDLAMLSQGVVRPPGGTRGDALQQAGNLVNVLGQRSGHNLYLVDGATVTDQHFNNMVIAPSVDSIDEFNIQKTSYAPEFGGKSGAVINVITRSGTNQMHGALFEFVRNDVFDAKNFFDSPMSSIPPFRQNQFGGSFGGPVLRNRTFFFVSYEGQRVRKSLTQTFSVPTDAMRRGDFSGLPALYDPSTSGPGGQRQPFANNRIPVDTVAAGILARIPAANLPGIAQNLRATGIQDIHANQYSARLDHRIGEKDSAFLRVSLFDARQFDPFGSGVLQESLLPGFGRTLSTHSINGVAAWTHTFNANLLNEARVGALWVDGGQRSPNAGTNFAAQTGLLGVTSNPLDMGYPQFNFGGQFTTMGDPSLFTFRSNHDVEFADNFTMHRGRHTAKFGVYAMQYRLRPVNPNGARGIFSYTPRWTSSAPGLADGNAFADFLLGAPTTAQVGLGRADMDASVKWIHLYAQDSWQLTPHFKIDAGLRYEYNPNMTEARNRMAAVDLSQLGARFVIASDGSGQIAPDAPPLLPFIPIPYVTSTAAGWDNSLLDSRPGRFAPRAGFAWSTANSQTVVRGGLGIYPNQAAYSIITNFAQNLPFFVTKTVSSSATAAAPSFSTVTALTANTVGTVGANNLDHDFDIEYNEVWNLNVERELGSATRVSAAYVGSRTVHADSATVRNVPLPGPGAIAARRPVPQLSQFNTIRWDGWATYHALMMELKRSFTKGLMFNANWTWSHSIDDASDPGPTLNEANLPQDVRNMAAEKATSSFDHRHRLAVSFVYQLPALGNDRPRPVRALLGRWQAGGYFTTQLGAPFTVNIASDQANIGPGPAQRPNVSADPNRGPRTPDRWFDTTQFSLPALFTFGNSPRNAVIGPGLREFDLSLQKEIPIRETTRLQFRAEAYNLFNHPNFNIPIRTAFTANFGRISSALDSRQLQLALKLAF